MLFLFVDANGQKMPDSLRIEFGVNGLTCSVCSKAVELSILKLDFVLRVDMDLANTEGKIRIKPGTKLDFGKVAKAIEQAGFSVRFMNVYLDKRREWEISEDCIVFDFGCLQLMEGKIDVSADPLIFKLVDKEFMPKVEFRKKFKKPENTCCINNKHFLVTQL